MDRVRNIVATIFEVPAEEVTASSSPETIEKWDSLGRLVLTLELEQGFGVLVTPEETEKLASVGSIVEWLVANNAGALPMDSPWAP